MSFQDILQWWNIIYAAPLVVSLVWIVATVLTGAHGVGSHGHLQYRATVLLTISATESAMRRTMSATRPQMRCTTVMSAHNGAGHAQAGHHDVQAQAGASRPRSQRVRNGFADVAGSAGAGLWQGADHAYHRHIHALLGRAGAARQLGPREHIQVPGGILRALAVDHADIDPFHHPVDDSIHRTGDARNRNVRSHSLREWWARLGMRSTRSPRMRARSTSATPTVPCTGSRPRPAPELNRSPPAQK